jgi:glycosyltransferase involved in cell wall biosynthesis
MTWRGVWIARKLGVPLVHTEHGSDFVKGVSFPIALASRIVDVTLGRRALRSADRVLGVSEAVASFVDRLAGVSADVFYNAIDLPDPSTETVAQRADFVFVGRLVPGKGADRAIDALAVLTQQSRVSARLIVLGDGPMRPDLERLARNRGLADAVLFKGRVSPREVVQELTAATLVNPSTLSEGFQTTLLEAAASGAQIVTYSLPGVEALRNAGAPVQVVDSSSVDALAEAMRSAVESPLPRWERRAALKWSWRERAAEYVDLLNRTSA